MSVQTESFINKVKGGAAALWPVYKVLPSVAIAQAALESAWGTSGLASNHNNLFGIKGSYGGNAANMVSTSSRNRQFLLISFLHFLLNKFLHFLIEIHSLYFSSCSFRHSFVSLQHGGEDDLGLQSQSLHRLEVLPSDLDFCLTLI